MVQQIGEVSSGGFFLIFWMFQNPPDLFYSLIKGMAMATVIVLVGCYYGYNASGGPVGVGTATAKSMVLNTVMVHLIGMVGTQIFWGSNPRAPIGGGEEAVSEERREDETGRSRHGGRRGPLDPRDWEETRGETQQEPHEEPGSVERTLTDERAAPPTRVTREDIPDNIIDQTREGEEPYQWHRAARASTVPRTPSSSST